MTLREILETVRERVKQIEFYAPGYFGEYQSDDINLDTVSLDFTERGS
jgi:hypothetical protein